MRSTDIGVKIYNLTAGKAFPVWTTPEQRKKLSKDEAYRSRVMVLQDFDMPEASQKMKMTRDERHLFVSGTYKPRIKCYEVAELSCKFERALEEEIVDFEILTDDFSKLCMLGASNTVTFHAKYGHYHATRLAAPARSLRYDRATCDLYIVGATNELLRLNLEAGRFLPPIGTEFDEESGINIVSLNPVHSLIGLAGADGIAEFRDPRAPDKSPIARLDISQMLFERGEVASRSEAGEVTALEFRMDGLHLGIGSSSGHVSLFDLRMERPLVVKDHRNERAIHTIKFHGQLLFSADSKVIRGWDMKTGNSNLSLETDGASSDFLIWPDSGLLLAAGETPHTMAYYIPSLGKAPRWCAFLDSVTEEMEERKVERGEDEIFENFKFVTREELTAIGGDSLIGTKYIRRYMHGFFLSSKLFKQLRAVALPHLDEAAASARLSAAVETLRSSRISVPTKPVPNKPKKDDDDDVEDDDRFRSISSDPKFAVDDERFREVTKRHKTDNVRVFEADDEDVFRQEKEVEKKKKKVPLGQRVSEVKEKEREMVSKSEIRFLSKETKAAIEKKKQEKAARIQHNKGRRKLTTGLNGKY